MTDAEVKALMAAFNERDEWGTAFDMLRSLNEQGLDLCAAAEREVLNDAASIDAAVLRTLRRDGPIPVSNFAVSELARREGKP